MHLPPDMGEDSESDAAGRENKEPDAARMGRAAQQRSERARVMKARKKKRKPER